MNRPSLRVFAVLLTLVCGCSFSEPTALEIAEGHIRQAQWELALGSSDTLIRTDPNNHLGYLIHGRANLALNHREAAIADLTHAIRLAPKEPEAYYQRALAHEYLGQPLLATADRHAAQRRDPNYAIAFAYAGIQSPVVTETAKNDDDRSPIPTSAPTSEADDEDAQWSAAMLPLLGDDPGQDDPQWDDPDRAASSATRKNLLAPTVRKTNVPLVSQDSERPSKDLLALPNDFFGNPAHRFRPKNHLADSHKPLRPTGRDLNGPHTFNPGKFNPNAINPDTISQPSARINRGKYPLARWQAPGMSPAAGRLPSGLPNARPGVARSGSLKKCATAGLPSSAASKPLQYTAGQASRGTQRLRGSNEGSQAGRSKFKPVVVVPRRLLPSYNALPR